MADAEGLQARKYQDAEIQITIIRFCSLTGRDRGQQDAMLLDSREIGH
jgi:hypothetical protein